MRAMRSIAGSFIVPATGWAMPWLNGLPYAAIGLAVWPVLGISACLAGLAYASLAMFVIFLPLTAMGANGGAAVPTDAPAPELTRRAHAALLVLWSVTVWGTAALTALR